jgi:hypothetical protein
LTPQIFHQEDDLISYFYQFLGLVFKVIHPHLYFSSGSRIRMAPKKVLVSVSVNKRHRKDLKQVIPFFG